MALRFHGSKGISANGTDWAFQIATGGIVQKPSTPMFDVSSSVSVAATNRQTFNAIYVNRGNYFANNRFTAPVAGAYFFTFSTIKSASSTTTVVRSYLYKNGAALYNNRHLRLSEGTNYGEGSCSWLVQLNVGDYVEVWIGAGASHPSHEYTWFNGFYLG